MFHKSLLIILIITGVGVMARRHEDVTVSRWLWVRSPFEEINDDLLIFSFLRSRTKERPGVKFRHSTRNALKNVAESRERSVHYVPSAYPAVCRIQPAADLL